MMFCSISSIEHNDDVKKHLRLIAFRSLHKKEEDEKNKMSNVSSCFSILAHNFLQ